MRREPGKGRKGQGLTEYIIVVALVAVAGIGIVNIFGNQLRNQFLTIVKAMSGSETATVQSLAGKAGTEANQKNLSTYAGSK
jgi:Flp pilus assembly pilin Flp